jgi:hypothetical protein
MGPSHESMFGHFSGVKFLRALLPACVILLLATVTCFASTVSLQWTPDTDTSVVGYKVYYKADSSVAPLNGTGAAQGASPIDVAKLTSTSISGLDPLHAYYFAVTAYNAAGVESPYSNSVSIPELTPPTASITFPANNATASGTVSVTASASDNVGVTSVEFYVNGVLKATDTSTPYLYSWNTAALAAGAYTLSVKAYDAAGNVGTSGNVAVTVATDTTAPSVSLTAPANGATLSGTVSLTASASDNIGVSKVEFYDNGTLLSAGNVAPFSYSWNTASVANGSHTLTAKAYDASNNVGQSTSVAVTVNNGAADTTAPVASLTAPAAGSTVTGTVAVSASASDNVAVSKVEFYVNGVLQATDTASPYTFSWNTAALANGSYPLSIKAYDAAGNVGSSASVTVAVNNAAAVAPSSYSIWPGTAAPAVADSGPDSSVELGVKFKSDTSGNITGIRFYKASTNTGTHTGTLWSATGTKLASASFANETASGWQQVNFATPVAITANTVYVASYHANAGHYSDDQSFFSGKGADNAPLHALADGVSGFNSVYAYGSTSVFPNQGYLSTNYWVDVAFATGSVTAPTLSSITVSPGSQTLSSGSTLQLAATGSYSDGSSKVLTSSATWSSSNTAAATVSSGGLVTAVKAGSSSISATFGGITGSATLTVPVAVTALSISTASLPSGTQNASYSTTLAATGGTAPYLWSITSGTLVAGLTLNAASGVISGTPTASGSCTVTIGVTDSASTKQAVAKTMTLSIAAASTTGNTSLWSSATVPGTADAGADSSVELGVKFRSDTSGYITGIRFYKSKANTGTHIGSLWSASGTKLASATFVGETASGWQQVNFATPVAITANTVYVASYHANVGHYSDDQNFFLGKGVDTAPLHALADAVSGASGAYAYGSTSTFPSLGYKSSNYWVDLVYHP